jgi:prophage regulatory protein
MTAVALQPDRSLRPKQAAEFIGVSESTLWAWVKSRQDFPKPSKLSPKITVFSSSALLAFRDAQQQKAGA